MNSDELNPARFREARERAGLSVAEVAERAGVSDAAVWDLESYDDEMVTACSVADLRRFAGVLSVAPRELLGVEAHDAPVSAAELASAIREHCRVKGITTEEFGDAVGWDVYNVVDEPKVLDRFNIECIRDVCGALGIDWQRFVSGLSAEG